MKHFRPQRWAKAAAIAAAAALLAVGGCSRGPAGGGSGGDSLEFFLNMGADTPQYKVMTELIDTYEQQKGITINVTQASTDYEDQMKVRLASGNIPDLFSTHGWSLLRYSKFLEPLTDQPWAKDVNPALDSAMRDADGNIYAFPGETDVAGILYNSDVLTAAGVDPATVTTWDAFDAAAKAVEAKGKTPIYSSGKSQGPAGHIADYLAIDAYSQSQLDQLKAGTFVDAPYKELLTRVQTWQKNGWFNKDYSSASQDDMARALADGTVGFEMMQTAVLSQALTYNPDAKIGFLPLPPTTSDQPYLVGGEGVDSFGVSKDSTRKQEALDFLTFLSQQENAAKLAESTASAPGLKTVKVDFGSLAPSFEAYVTPGTTPVKAYFDRVYLPNGMWNTLVATTDSVIAGQGSVDAATEQVKRQFDTLYGQQ